MLPASGVHCRMCDLSKAYHSHNKTSFDLSIASSHSPMTREAYSDIAVLGAAAEDCVVTGAAAAATAGGVLAVAVGAG